MFCPFIPEFYKLKLKRVVNNTAPACMLVNEIPELNEEEEGTHPNGFSFERMKQIVWRCFKTQNIKKQLITVKTRN